MDNIELITKLEKAKSEKNRLAKYQKELIDLKKALNKRKKENDELYKILDKEHKDYKRISNLSISALYHLISGSKEQKLKKEREEYLEAKLKFEESKNSIELIRERISFIDKEIRRLEKTGINYQNLIKEKEKYLLTLSNERSKELINILEQISDWEIIKEEAKEALKAGNEAVKYLTKVIYALNNAEELGNWDLFGGGMLVDMAKHEEIDIAKVSIPAAQLAINKYINELGDVNQKIDLIESININELDKFYDFFFDGFVADFTLLEKIKNSKSNIKSVINKISDMQKKLKNSLSDIEKEQQKLNSKRIELIEN